MAETKDLKFKNLDIIRKANNLTVEQMMGKLGKTRDTWYKWQAPDGEIKSADLRKIHDMFNISVDCILDIQPVKIYG